MKDQQFSRWLRFLLWALLIGTGVLAAVYAYLDNPNTVFRKQQRQFEREYKDVILPLRDSQQSALSILTPDQWRREQSFYKKYQARLGRIDPRHLTEKNKIAYRYLERDIHSRLTFLKQLQQDPALYNLGGKLKAMLAQPETPLKKRVQHIGRLLADSGQYFQAAKNNLRHPIPKQTELCIEKQLLTLDFLQSEWTDSMNRANLSSQEKATLQAQTDQAVLAVKDYLAFCKSLQFEHRDSTIYRRR